MAEQKAPQMQATLGLTGLTSNAMALIAPGAFLWLTFFIQATTGTAGQPSTAPAMWWGILLALGLCLATAVAYAEISKLYPGTGSSYYYAEQALLSKDKAFKYARIAKFIVGWGSHLYYWVYPGRDGGNHRHLRRLCRRILLSELHQRIQSRPGLHGAGRHRVLVLRCVDRAEGRGRVDGGKPGHQRHPDFRIAGLQRARAGLSRQPSDWITGVQLRRPVARNLHLPVRHRQGRLHRPRRKRRSPAAARHGRQAGSVHDRLSRNRRDRQHAHAPDREVGSLAAQFQLGIHSGDCRHSDPGRL